MSAGTADATSHDMSDINKALLEKIEAELGRAALRELIGGDRQAFMDNLPAIKLSNEELAALQGGWWDWINHLAREAGMPGWS